MVYVKECQSAQLYLLPWAPYLLSWCIMMPKWKGTYHPSVCILPTPSVYVCVHVRGWQCHV
jgi:hypothetical protein